MIPTLILTLILTLFYPYHSTFYPDHNLNSDPKFFPNPNPDPKLNRTSVGLVDLF